MTDVSAVGGQVLPGYGRVADAFAQNLNEFGEIGAACSVYVDGELAVDLRGGLADAETRTSWSDQTIVMVYSTSKGLTAMCAHLLAQRGELDFGRPVADYWPEFAANGKDQITTRDILSHRAGLPVIDRKLTPDEVLAGEPVVAALADQAPAWEPGTRHGYHALTYGWLIGEIVRRVTGQSLGDYFAREIAAPLRLNTWIGLPASQEHRVAPVITPTMADFASAQASVGQLDDETRATATAVMAAFNDPDSLTMRASTLNGTMRALPQNSRGFRAAEIPSVNAMTDARSLARAYSACVAPVAGCRILDADTISSAIKASSDGPDAILLAPTRFGLGFGLATPANPFLGVSSFGHAGMGGSLAFADVDHRVGFGYVMNKLGVGLAPIDARAGRLIDALRNCMQ